MRIKTLILFLSLGYLLSNSGYPQFLNWQYEDLLTDTVQSGASPDLLVGPNGDFHMTYWEPGTDNLFYAFRSKFNGTWEIEAVAPSLACGYRSSLALNGNGEPCIAFFENVGGTSVLWYGEKEAAGWRLSKPLADSSWGKYGPDNRSDTYIQTSLDLQFLPNGEPFIALFDARVYAFATCDETYTISSPSNYELDLQVCYRSNAATWQSRDLDQLLTTLPNCDRRINSQDRFGEFCQVHLQGDSLRILTNSLYNNDLIMLSALASAPQNWKLQRLDSVERLLNVPISYEEGFHYPKSILSQDSFLHAVYGLSEAYGLTESSGTFDRPASYRNVTYSRFDLKHPDSAFHHEFFSSPGSDELASFFAIASRDPDSIFLAYHNLSSRTVILQQSTDAGLSWEADTIFSNIATNAPLVCVQVEDSLFVGCHDGTLGFFRMASRSLQDSIWQYGLGTRFQQRAFNFQAVKGQGGEVHMVFSEEGKGNLVYGKGQSANWRFENIPAFQGEVQDVTIAHADNGTAGIAYALKTEKELGLFFLQNNSWQQEILSVPGDPEFPRLQLIGDSAHLIFFNRDSLSLYYAKSLTASNSWEVIRLTDSLFSNPEAVLRTGPQENLHLFYRDLRENDLKYAKRENGTWQFEVILDSLDFQPASLEMMISSSNGQPKLLYRDPGRNTLSLVEKENGLWEEELVFQSQQFFLGDEVEMVLDPQENPWVLFQLSGSQQELALLRRDSLSQQWIPISINNNRGKIGENFSFLLNDLDFYLIGRKTRPGEGGVASLFAPNGVTTDLESSAREEFSVELFPNPSSGNSDLRFSFPLSPDNELKLFNSQGQLLQSIQLPAGATSYALQPQEAAGLYVVQVKNGSSHRILKWLVIRD
jgi:hypothetical protein